MAKVFFGPGRKEQTRSVLLQPEEHIQVVVLENQSGTRAAPP